MNVKFLLLLSVVTATIGQILFKKGMSVKSFEGMTASFMSFAKGTCGIIFSPVVLSGLTFYALSTVLWLAALSKTQLNYAYPFTALTYVLVMFSSYFLFSEVMPLNRLIGVAIICVGIIVSSLR